MSACAGILQGLHAAIAYRRGEQHWLLNDADAKVYGQAVSNALRHIPIRVAQKSIDFGMLFFAACQFDFPRIVMSGQIARAKAAQRAQGGPPGATVYQFTRQPPPPPQGPPAGSASPHGAPGGQGAAGPGSATATGSANGAGVHGVDMSIEPEPDIPRFGP